MVKQCTADFWEDKADEKAQDMNEKRLGGYCDDRIRWRFEDTVRLYNDHFMDGERIKREAMKDLPFLYNFT